VRELHVAGLSPDGRQLLLSSSEGKAPAYAVVLDARFDATLRGEPTDGETEVRPTLSPREIQAAVRAGESVESVAARAGLPVSRVERYAGPVLSERARVLDVLLDVPQSGRRGVSSMPLGQAVNAALSELMYVRPETISWTAYRQPEGDWVARLTLVVRGREREAQWSYDAEDGSVRPLDTYASTLGHAEGARRSASRPRQPAPRTTAGRRSATGTKATKAKKATKAGTAASRASGAKRTGARRSSGGTRASR
jgi:hypothetical protein